MKEVMPEEFKIYPIRSCKIKITESQYSRLFLGNKLVVKGDEDLLQEQWYNDAWHWVEDAASDVADAYMAADKAVGDYVVDPLFSGVASAGNWVYDTAVDAYEGAESTSLRDLEVEFSSWLDKNVGKPAQINGAYIWSDIVRAFGEAGEIPASFGKLFSFLTDGKNWSQVGGGFKLMGITLMDWKKNLKDVAAGFGMLWDEVSGWPEELWDWLKTWTVQDWIDLAAIICFIIPYPPLWAVGVGLEAINVGISVYKGQYTDAGLRAFFIVGGALLSKTVSTTYKVSAEALEEGTETIVKVAKVAQESGDDAARKTLAELTKGSDAETKKFVQDVYKKIAQDGKVNFSALDQVKYQMADIRKLTKKYMTSGMSEAKAIDKAVKETVGEDIYNAWLRHMAAESGVERILLSGVSGVALTLKFKNFLKAQGMEKKIAQYDKLKEEQVEEIVNTMSGISKKSEELQKEAILLAAQNWEAEAEKEILELQESYPEIDVNSDDFDQQFIDAMTKPKTKLNEEIYRMKELFSNKRLYGNLIT